MAEWIMMPWRLMVILAVVTCYVVLDLIDLGEMIPQSGGVLSDGALWWTLGVLAVVNGVMA